MNIHENALVAITGRSGVGKSTLLRLIAGIYSPISGKIFLGANDITDLSPNQYRHLLIYIPQEPSVFPGTIKYNLLLADCTANDQQLSDAINRVSLSQFISGKPEGWNTFLGNDGLTLSGGEKQRLALAQAILKNSPIILMDEPTSALDQKTENAIIESLLRLKENHTILIVTHSNGIIQVCDQVVQL